MSRNVPAITADTQYVQEVLWTDTVVYQVMGLSPTGQTLKIRLTEDGEIVKREFRDGNPYPLIYRAVQPYERGQVRSLRRRQDGTFRIGRNVLSPAMTIEGTPVRFSDYRD